MAKLKDKIKTALDEARMLTLGSQVLIGFQFRAVFESGFERLPDSSKYLKLVGLVLLLIVTCLLMSPGAYHRIVAEGEDTPEVHRFTTRVMTVALLPFALSLGLDMYVITRHLLGFAPGVVFGVLTSAAAIFFWYVLEVLRRARDKQSGRGKQMNSEKKGADDSGGGTKLKDKVDQTLTEARVVLPGAQALLGFQFISMLTEGFDSLEMLPKYVHLSSLCLIALSVVLLMTPAAYHRIVEEGENTEHFHRTASRLLVAAMAPLALGICGDLFVVAYKITKSTAFSAVSSLLMLSIFYGFWFGYTYYRRRQKAATA